MELPLRERRQRIPPHSDCDSVLMNHLATFFLNWIFGFIIVTEGRKEKGGKKKKKKPLPYLSL